ncbi:MAG: HAD family phosphatase [Chthoniobacterales bacterium]
MELQIPNKEYQGHIFDCDGTLADTMPLHFRAWTRVMKEFGGEFPEDLFYSWGGTPTVKIVSQLNEKFGSAMDAKATAAQKEVYFRELIPETKPILPVVEIARALRGKVKMAIASGGFRHLVVETLDALNITDWFDVIVAAEDYEHGKPSPDPFLLAAKKLGVEPGQCIVYEDSPLGIQAAKAAGMDYVFIPTPVASPK